MSETSEAKLTKSKRFRDILNVATSAALLIAAVTVTWTTLARPKPPTSPEPKVPSSLQSIKGVPWKGNPSAPAVLIEYSDFQCPFCRRFVTDILPTLEEKYISSGQLLLAFRHYPLDRIHPLARGAAEAAACAFRQGKFWETHDEFFRKEARLDAAGLLSAVMQAKLERGEWEKCVMARPVKEVADDVARATELGLRSTPFFLLGISTSDGVKVTKVWSGARPMEFVGQAIDETLLLSSK